MRIIYRYIMREFGESFFFGLLVFSIILLLDQIFQLVNLALAKGVSLFTVFKMFMLIIPTVATLAIPMATLFAILLAYGRLAEDNEITALRSSGVSYTPYTVPLLIIAVFLSIFLGYFNQVIAPKTHHQFRQLYTEALRQRPLVRFEEKSIISIDSYKLFASRIHKKGNILEQLTIYKFSPADKKADENTWRISAASATVSITPQAIIFHLNNGYWQKPNPQSPERLIHLTFDRYAFLIKLTENTLTESQSVKEMSGRELRAMITQHRAQKIPSTFFETEYWLRWMLASAPLVFALIGIPIGMVLERGGKSISFGLSLVVLFGYYIVLATGLSIAEKGFIPPGVILWLPNALTLFSSIFLWKRMLNK